MCNGVKRQRINVYGVVQGVGFRPFVKNLAARAGVFGSVCNKGPYVEIIAESGEQKLVAFLHALKAEAPARAEIMRIDSFEEIPEGLVGFDINKSAGDTGAGYVSPDIAFCDDCRRELYDKNNRRYLHPFINCTACGPRLTILDSMPYDRERTSMADFKMCPPCSMEYADSGDRRYHAQPVCCPDCGPKLYTLNDKIEGDVIAAVRKVIRGGGVAAVKGIGGFHLCCDAKNEEAVKRLRSFKNRPYKPFAVMARDIETARRECVIERNAETLLDSPQKPILLLQHHAGGYVCEAVAPGNPRLGLMLPYAPLQLLLFDYPDGELFTDCLVMTSGNVSGAPICKDDKEAAAQLTDKCDIILSNDREIRMRADDSVMALYNEKPIMLRRSRGYAPLPVIARVTAKEPVFAVGGELKNSFCLMSGDRLYMSPFIGDMTDLRCVKALDETSERLMRLLAIEPKVVASDLHPHYNSAAYAAGLKKPILRVQHHFAHIAACMAENSLDGEVIGVAFDGTGYGSDGAVWGGEFLRVSYKGFERLGSLEPYKLAGADKAAVEGFRPALSLMIKAFGDVSKAKRAALEIGLCDERDFDAQVFMMNKNINCVTTTSAGRLFDAVSAILNIKRASTFEGEAAAALEYSCDTAHEFLYNPLIKGSGPFVINSDSVIQYIIRGYSGGESAARLASDFHIAVAQMIIAGARKSRELTGLERVALSGGVFQNLRLLDLCVKGLSNAGFSVFIHSKVPAGDGGIALGQAVVAAEYFSAL